MHNLKNTVSSVLAPLKGNFPRENAMLKGLGIIQLVVTFLLLSLSLLSPGAAYAKGGDVLWQSSDVREHRQQAVASAVDTAGNLVMTGFRNMTNDTDDDFWTVKFDTGGNVLWRVAYNSNFGSDQATSVIVDANNDVIVTGYAWNGFNNDIYTVKYNGTDGTIIWSNTYSGASNGNDVGIALALDSSANMLYVGGYTQNAQGNEDFLILKYDNNNTLNNPPQNVITKSGTSGGNDRIASLAANADGLCATGTSWNGSDFDVLTVMFEHTGAERWQKQYSSTGSYQEAGRYVKFDATGNVVLAATSSNQLDFDIYVAKYAKADGNAIWEKSYNGAFDDEPMGLAVGGDGDIYVTGYTWTLAGSNDFYTARLSGTSGNTIWQHVYNSSYDNSDMATATGIVVDDSINGDVFVTGYTVTNGNYDFRTLKYKKENGHLLWQQSYNGPANHNDRTVGIAFAPNNGLYIAGWSDKTAPVVGETSIATGGTLNTIVTAGKSWTVNQWASYFIMVTSGSNSGISRKIVSNSADTIVISPDFGAAVNAGDSYYIFDKDNNDLHLIKYDRGDLNPPTNLLSQTVEKAGDGTYKIRLTWEDNSPDETGFIIERKLGELGTWGEVNRVPANILTYDDAGLAANEYFYYRVKSYRLSDESYPSNESHSLTFLVSYINPIWQLSYNGGENMEDYITSIGVGPDDNPVVTGRSDSGLIGMFDFLTIKINRDTGVKIWEDRYDSMQNEMDNAVCLAVDSNNDIVVSGFSSLYYAPAGGNVHSVFTMKYPSAGPPATWEKQYNGPGGIDDRASAIASATDGSNIYVVGYGQNSRMDNDIYLIKYLADGTQSWAITPIDGGRHDYPSAITLDPSGNVVITGYRQGARGEVTDLDNFDFYTAKFSPSGTKLWEDAYNPNGDGDARGAGITTDTSGDVYIAGYASKRTGSIYDKDFYTIKYNGSNGVRVWERTYDGPAQGNDWAIGIKTDPIIGKNPLDSNIVVVGTRMTDAADNDSDVHIIRYSKDGEEKWSRTLLRPNEADVAEAVAMDGSGYIYIAADTGNELDKNIISVIYDYEGTLLGGTTYNGGYGFDQASSIAVNHQGEAFTAGYTTNASQNADFIVIKQKNSYKLVPTPFTATPQADYTQIVLNWRNNSPGSRFSIERTPGPATTDSIWTPLVDLAPGTTSYPVTGLSENTEYCYRIEAYEGSIPSRKVIACGITTLHKPVINSSGTYTKTSLAISWANIPGNTGYKVERKVGAGTWELAPNGTLGANVSSYTDTGLANGSQYTYRVSAKNGLGYYSLASDDKILWTLPAEPTLNTPVIDWAARVDLSWTNTVGETGFRVERKIGVGGTWETVATKGVDVLTHSDTTAQANTQYYYRIVAYNTSGDSAGNEQPALTKASPAVVMLNSDNSVTGQITVNWTDHADETGYTLQQSTCSYGASGYDPVAYCLNYMASGTNYWSAWSTVNSPLQNVTSQLRTGLSTAYMYRYRIIASVSGNTTEPSNIKGAWAWLASPNPLTVSPATTTSLSLTWTNIVGESKYEIWRKQGQGGTYAKIADPALNASSYTDSGLLEQTEYCYQVKAVNLAGNADAVAPPPSVSEEKCLPTPLPAPVLNTPVTVSATQVDLSWNNVIGNTGYELERCRYHDPNMPQDAPGNINQPINYGYWLECTTFTKDTDVTTHQDTALTAGYTYRYQVRDKYGVTPVNYSGWSNKVVATTIPPMPTMYTPTANSPTQLTPTWTNVAGDIGYRLEWKPRSGADCTAGTWNPYIAVGQNTTSYAHGSLSANTFYCYQIKAVNGTMMSPTSTPPVSQTTTTVAPVLSGLTVLSTSSVRVAWNEVAGATNYRISRKLFPSGAYGVIATVASTSLEYTDAGLAAGTMYGYEIEAQNAGGFSPYSNEMTTTTKPASTVASGTVVSNTQIDLSWVEMKGATNYMVERRTPGGTWGEIVNLAVPYVESYCGNPLPRIGCQSLSANSTGYSDTTLSGGGSYCYQVFTWNSTGGKSAASPEICLDTAELASPILTATPNGSLKVGLSWIYTPGTCVTGPCEAPTGYLIEKQLYSGSWQRIKVTDAATTAITDIIGIEPLKRYQYRAQAFAGIVDLFDAGVSATKWTQFGRVVNSAGSVVTTDTVPPINIVDTTNGNVNIAATPGGGVQLATSSTAGGTANSFNYSRLNMIGPEAAHGNFDVQVEYRLATSLLATSQYHVYGRLHVNLPVSIYDSSANYAYIEQNTLSGYSAVITIEGFQFTGSLATTDTSSRLRLTRNGDRITAYAWTGGAWKIIATASGANDTDANGVNFTQYAQRNEAVSMKVQIDNFQALSNKSAYSQPAAVTTPGYVTQDGNCQ